MSGEVYILPSASTCIIIAHPKKKRRGFLFCFVVCFFLILVCSLSPASPHPPPPLTYSLVCLSHRLSFADVRDQSDNRQEAIWHEIQIEDIQCQHPDVT